MNQNWELLIAFVLDESVNLIYPLLIQEDRTSMAPQKGHIPTNIFCYTVSYILPNSEEKVQEYKNLHKDVVY